jgi:hypothetical protein
MSQRHRGLRLGVWLVLVAVGVLAFSASAFAETKTSEPDGETEFTVPSGVSSRHSAYQLSTKTPTHQKPTPRTKETPVQRATVRTLIHLAAQIIADYNQAKGAPFDKGVAHDRYGGLNPGLEEFTVVYPLGPNATITDSGTGMTRVVSLGGTYTLQAYISYPRNDRHPPKISLLNNLVDVEISESLGFSGITGPPNYATGPNSTRGPAYSFGAGRNRANGGKGQWALAQSITSASTPLQDGGIATLHEWVFAVGNPTSSGHTSAAPLTMAVLKTETSEAQTFLTNAKQYIATPVTTALEAPLPPPTSQRCENGGGVTNC